MDMFSITLTKSAQKSLSKIPSPWRERLAKVIDGIAHDPFMGKKLKGELRDYYSLRVWPYRILYQIFKKELVVIIVTVGHRQNVYN